MDESEQRLAGHARTVLSAAQRVEFDATDRDCAPEAAEALTSIGVALHALGRACHAAGRSIIPPGDPGESISTRYARAAARWPGAATPSHEQQAQLLASLDDAGATLRAAADAVARAGRVLAVTVGPVDGDESRRTAA